MKTVMKCLFVLMVFSFILLGCSGQESADKNPNNGTDTSVSSSIDPNATTGNVSNTDAGTDQDPKTTDEEAIELDAEPADIVIYSDNGTQESAYYERFGNYLAKKFPHYNFTFLSRYEGETQNLNTAIVSGVHFDIYFGFIDSYIKNMVDFRLAVDMTDLIKKHNVDLTRIDSANLSPLNTVEEGMIGLPIYTDSLILMYNKDLFDRFGIDYPTDGMTWSEMYALAEQFSRSEDGVQYIGFAPNVGDLIYANPLSIPIVDQATGMPTINTDSRWETFYREGILAAGDVRGVRDFVLNMEGNIRDNFLKNQTIAMYMTRIQTTVNKTLAESLYSFNWDMVSLPTFESKPHTAAQPIPLYFGVTSLSEQQDASMKVIHALLDDEHQRYLAQIGFVPVLKDENVRKEMGQALTEGIMQGKDKHWDAIFYNQWSDVPYIDTFQVNVRSIYQKYGTQLLRGEVDLITALRQADEEAKLKLEEMRVAN